MSFEVVCADVMDWAERYTGPPFHAMLTDPPYHLHSGNVSVDWASFPRTSGRGGPKGPTNQEGRNHKAGFMGKKWDGGDIAFQPQMWRALGQHLYPGAFVLAFASSKGWHRVALALEEAGYVLQPSIFVQGVVEMEMEVPLFLGWLTGQSFPKSTRIDTQVDKAAGRLEEREVIGSSGRHRGGSSDKYAQDDWTRDNAATMGMTVTAPVTDLAQAWAGHRYGGQILRNNLEPIIVAQWPWGGKRLDDIVQTGAGTMWVDGARIGTGDNLGRPQGTMPHPMDWGNKSDGDGTFTTEGHPQGRWPSNYALVHHPECRPVGTRRVKGSGMHGDAPGGFNPTGRTLYGKGNSDHDVSGGYAGPDGYETVTAWDCHSDCPARQLGEMSGESKSSGGGGYREHGAGPNEVYGTFGPVHYPKNVGKGDVGTATRFYFQADWSYEAAERLAMTNPAYYCPKAHGTERDRGLEGLFWQKNGDSFERITRAEWATLPDKQRAEGNIHVAQKPLALTQWLATLLLPPEIYESRRVLVPFCGAGSEGCGALLAGWEEVVGIDLSDIYCMMSQLRMQYWASRPRQLQLL